MKFKKNILKICLIILLFICLLFAFKLFYNNKNGFTTMETPPFPIDVVYSWAGENTDSTNNRVAFNNELKYSLRSLFKYAPWVNKVYILMNPPKTKPSWFNEQYKDKIILVDHNDTFDSNDLPCTNSNSIETTLVNINGLSEHFIYFNDDFYLGNYVSYLDFYTKDGKKMIIQDNFSHNCESMILDNKTSSFNFDLPIYCGISDHKPMPYLKSVVKKFHEKYSDYIKWIRTIKSKSKHYPEKSPCKDNNLKEWCMQQNGLICKYAFDNGYANTHNFSKDNQVIYTSYGFDPQLKELFNIEKYHPKYFCINDSFNDSNIERKKFFNKINKFMQSYFPEKPFFEN